MPTFYLYQTLQACRQRRLPPYRAWNSFLLCRVRFGGGREQKARPCQTRVCNFNFGHGMAFSQKRKSQPHSQILTNIALVFNQSRVGHVEGRSLHRGGLRGIYCRRCHYLVKKKNMIFIAALAKLDITLKAIYVWTL